MLVLVLQVVFDKEFGMFFQRPGPMKVVGYLATIDGIRGIFGFVDDPYCVPIGLCTVRHEAFEVMLGNSMPSHDVVEVMLENHLSIIVLGSEVAANDGHDALVGSIVYVAGHGGPLGNVFDMVRHDPSMLEIPTRLHVPNQVDPTTRANFQYLENESIVRLVTPGMGIDSA